MFFKNSFQKIKQALTKTKNALSLRLQALFSKPLTDETFDQLEQILFEADLGSACIEGFMQYLKTQMRKRPLEKTEEILPIFHEYALQLLQSVPISPIPMGSPHIVLVVGVNGSGKTTSIAKLAYRYQKEGKKVLLAAGDTFRAAAIEQLEIWARRLDLEIILSKPGADPAAVAFDAATAAKARGFDVVLIDTAGRLQNKADLMRELEKVRRSLAKVILQAPHETLLVLDATTGQNGIDQAQAFHAATPLHGIVLSKLDGSAKGGIVLSIAEQLHLPVLFVGTGERREDLEPFDVNTYVDSLFN
ncbi:MAG: hypothetical protein RLZZ453_173 [Chlamydiota bacterium]|jgi:fused signal recognition particle receptor